MSWSPCHAIGVRSSHVSYNIWASTFPDLEHEVLRLQISDPVCNMHKPRLGFVQNDIRQSAPPTTSPIVGYQILRITRNLVSAFEVPCLHWK
jgi:hypothetical protein